MAVTKDVRILMVDFYNKKLKVFSSNTQNVSYLPLSSELRDITVVNETEVVVTMGCEQKLHIIDITNATPSVKETVHVRFDVMGIAACQDKFIVTCPNTKPPSVKKIDRKGTVFWTVSSDAFSDPWYVCSNEDGTKLALSDRESHTVTVVDGERGEIRNVRKVEGKHPRGLCMDHTCNIYMCYQSGIGVLTGDLSEEKILLSEGDGVGNLPEAIAYDSSHEKLFISYSPLHKNCNSVDSVQLIK